MGTSAYGTVVPCRSLGRPQIALPVPADDPAGLVHGTRVHRAHADGKVGAGWRVGDVLTPTHDLTRLPQGARFVPSPHTHGAVAPCGSIPPGKDAGSPADEFARLTHCTRSPIASTEGAEQSLGGVGCVRLAPLVVSPAGDRPRLRQRTRMRRRRPVHPGGEPTDAYGEELPGRNVRWVVESPADYLARFADCACVVSARTHRAVAPRWCTGHPSPAHHFARVADCACMRVAGAERKELPRWRIRFSRGVGSPTHQLARRAQRTGVIHPGAYSDYPLCFSESLGRGRRGCWLGRGGCWGRRLGRGGRQGGVCSGVAVGGGVCSGVAVGGGVGWGVSVGSGSASRVADEVAVRAGGGVIVGDGGAVGVGVTVAGAAVATVVGGGSGESPQATKMAAASAITATRVTSLWWSAPLAIARPYHSHPVTQLRAATGEGDSHKKSRKLTRSHHKSRELSSAHWRFVAVRTPPACPPSACPSTVSIVPHRRRPYTVALDGTNLQVLVRVGIGGLVAEGEATP